MRKLQPAGLAMSMVIHSHISELVPSARLLCVPAKPKQTVFHLKTPSVSLKSTKAADC